MALDCSIGVLGPRHPFAVTIHPAALHRHRCCRGGDRHATWYAIDGDYVAAGLSLAAAVPGLAFGKIAKGVKAGAAAEKAAADAGKVAKVANEIRPRPRREPDGQSGYAEDVRVRPYLWPTIKAILEAAEEDLRQTH